MDTVELANRYVARAQRMQRALKLATEFRELFADDPELGNEFLQTLTPAREPIHAPTTTQPSRPFSPPKHGTHYDKILAFFEANGNAWATVREIAEAIGIPRNRFMGIFYTTHADLFESRDDPNNPRGKQWRRKAAA